RQSGRRGERSRAAGLRARPARRGRPDAGPRGGRRRPGPVRGRGEARDRPDRTSLPGGAGRPVHCCAVKSSVASADLPWSETGKPHGSFTWKHRKSVVLPASERPVKAARDSPPTSRSRTVPAAYADEPQPPSGTAATPILRSLPREPSPLGVAVMLYRNPVLPVFTTESPRYTSAPGCMPLRLIAVICSSPVWVFTARSTVPVEKVAVSYRWKSPSTVCTAQAMTTTTATPSTSRASLPPGISLRMNRTPGDIAGTDRHETPASVAARMPSQINATSPDVQIYGGIA